jgi:pimeloyl-ACP methyl ester carboxylesterase
MMNLFRMKIRNRRFWAINRLARLAFFTLVYIAALPVVFETQSALARPKLSGFYDWATLSGSIPPGKLLKYERLELPPFYRARAWRILYMTRDYAGKPIASSGMVIISDYAPPVQNTRKIVAWAHSTSGIARKCAPSLQARPTGSVAGFNELITGGYIITATDYPGLGTGGPAGYMVGKGQGQAVIDSVRAARQIPDVGGGKRFAMWGYSQGGHAALSAAVLAKEYAPELSLVGVATTAPPTNLFTLLKITEASAEANVFTALILQSWSDKYAIPLSTLVSKASIENIRKIAENCTDNTSDLIQLFSTQRRLPKRFLNLDPIDVQPWKRLLNENSVGRVPFDIPLYVVQGTADEIVKPSVTKSFVKQQCSGGNNIQFTLLNNVGHARSKQISSAAAIAWIGNRFAGRKMKGSCRTLSD